MDIETSGNIVGINHGDSKLQSIEASLYSREGSITCRRLRAQRCTLKARGIQVSSNLESIELLVDAGELGFQVGKRIGLDKKAKINSAGPIKIGSLFSMMRNLPTPTLTRKVNTEGVMINAHASVIIDSVQGVATIKCDAA